MTNAKASADPPTDPFEAAPPPPAKHRFRPATKSLPRGVSPDIFGTSGPPLPFAKAQQQHATKAGLPPAVPEVVPWPVKGPTLRELMRMRPPEPPKRPEPGAPREEPERARRPSRIRRMARVTIAVLGLVLAYLIPAWILSGKVLPGTTVAGIDVAGLTASAAAERLTDRISAIADADIAVKVGERRFTISPLKAGLSFDVAATVAELPTGFPGPIDLVRAVAGETRLRPRISVNEAKLKEQVELIAAEVDRPVYQGAVVYRGREPVVVAPRPGVRLDQDEAVEAIKAAYLNQTTPVELTVRTQPPTVSAEVLKRALPEARKAVAAPITLVNGDRRAVLEPETIAAHLRFEPDDSGRQVRPVFDARAGVASVEKDLLDPATAPRDATFRIVGGRPVLVPGRSGRGVDTDALAAAVVKAIGGSGSRTIPVVLTPAKPRLGNAEAARLGIKQKIASFSVRHGCCTGPATNIRKAVELVDGRVVRPGETFSLNETIGRPDQARGFVEAPAVENGRLVSRVGGGLSDLATALHHAVFHAGLRIVERRPHDFHLARHPLGLDAALAYPDTDLRWRNDSRFGVLIQAYATGGTVTVALWSTRRYDRVEAEVSPKRDVKPFETVTGQGQGCVPTQGANGFTVTVTRVFRKDGAEVKRDAPVTSVYRPQPRVVCEGSTRAVTERRTALTPNPAPAPTPTALTPTALTPGE